MLLFVVRRLGAAIPVVIGITLIAFVLVHVVPGDPAKVILYGANASPEQIATLRQQLGLDDPLWRQYADFAVNLVHGNLGTSFLTQTPVSHELLSRAPSTLILTATSMLVAVLVGVPLGLVAGMRPGSVLDTVARWISFAGVAVPYFFLALLLVLLFSVKLHLLSAIDDGTAKSLVLPAVSLGWGYAAILTRLVRGRVIDELRSDYVKSARARGSGELRVLLRQVLRNSSVPAVTTIGLQFGNILTGAAITEVIFGRAGLGSFLATSITSKNIPVVQGAVVVIGIAYVVINLGVDLIVGAIDPRTRQEAAA
ncbi:peptide/nickel transport system permease protein/oligopeptide transport system permease protein [Kribbella rubisoli]|uniref:Peptide/nickel transport system permease protein/oligopeptide transport system permease protein n=1 Tax=Kribbella rubisoli TaxID=3075929 RepID=A0A4Q7VZ21_9ACTN|nr:ABC transporter permease [Kribbella rubisoli]RZU01709.1 peptide/nickel transport system permease protein/oligopeptide transport system permease protein [Kribbella rubisoli]